MPDVTGPAHRAPPVAQAARPAPAVHDVQVGAALAQHGERARVDPGAAVALDGEADRLPAALALLLDAYRTGAGHPAQGELPCAVRQDPAVGGGQHPVAAGAPPPVRRRWPHLPRAAPALSDVNSSSYASPTRSVPHGTGGPQRLGPVRFAQLLVGHVPLQGVGRGLDVPHRYQEPGLPVGEDLGSPVRSVRGDHRRGLGERLQDRARAVQALGGHQRDVGVVEVVLTGLPVEQQDVVVELERGDEIAGLAAQRSGTEDPQLPARLGGTGLGEGVQREVDAPVRDEPSGADHRSRRRLPRALREHHRLGDVAHLDPGVTQRPVLGGGGVAFGQRDDRVQLAVELRPAGAHRLREPLDGRRAGGRRAARAVPGTGPVPPRARS